MSKRRHLRQTTRRRAKIARVSAHHLLYRRSLRYEPLEDRRLLAVVTVNTLSDVTNLNDNLTTLREAIFATNLVAGADTIQFAPSLTENGPATIVLTQGEVAINDSLTIDGPGSSLLTIDAGGLSRIFNVTTKVGDVTFEGMTLSKGRAANGSGGAVIVTAAHNMAFSDVIIADSTSVGGNGGGISVGAEKLTIENSTFVRNTTSAGSGGGVYTVAPTTIVGSRFTGNTARLGGGLAGTGAVQITDSTIAENTGFSGGGVWMNGNGSVAVTNSTIRGNKTVAGSAAGSGGGIGGEGRVTVVGSQIINNESALNGGGISTRNPVTIQNSILSGNRAIAGGGGVYISGILSTLAVNGGLIANNTAGMFETASALGGGFLLSGIKSASFDSSTIAANFASRAGGALWSTNSVRININNTTISGNTARIGGAIHGGVAVLRYSTVTKNSAVKINGDLGSGGGIVTESITIDHSIIAGNQEAGSWAPDVSNVVFATYSVIGSNKGSSLVEAPVGSPDGNGNLIGGPVHGVIDAKLGELKDNGGFLLPDGTHILTHALLAGSPALNAGNLSAVAGVGGVPQFDERGTPFSRVAGGRIDIGAFESQEPSDLNLLVDTLVDESDGNFSRGDLSLREAIELANKYPGPNYPAIVNTIHFDPALTAEGPASIVLSKGELAITHAMTIAGPSAKLLTINASGNDVTPELADGKGSRVFNITGPSPTVLMRVGIRGLAITGGDSAGSGGGILSVRADLTLTEDDISENFTREVGGGINSATGNLTLDHSSVIGNLANGTGGGVSATVGDLIIRDSLIAGNSLVSEKGSFGGGVYFVSQQTAPSNNRLEIARTTISGNTARMAGGGVFAHQLAGSLLIADSEISGNTTTGVKSRGGGIYLNGTRTTETIQDTRISNNKVAPDGFGGGVFLYLQALDVKNSTIVGNFGGADGGGISSVGSLRVFDSAIRENATQNSAGGGGIGAADTRSRTSDTGITRSTIANNQGSGVKLVGGNLTVTESTISGNTTSGSGGGIFAGEAVPQVMLTRTEISHNAAAVDGGGIQRVGGTNTTLAVTDNRIIENKAGRDGGGINISVPSSFAAKFGNTTVHGNSAGRAGGGIAKHGAGLISLSSSTLNDNMAAGNGGGLAADDGGTWIFESTVSGNTAGDLGGGLWTSKGATLDFSTIAKNTANAAGGGVLSSYGPVTLNHTIVGANTAPIARDLAGLLGAPIIPKFSLIGSNAGSGLAEAPLGSPDVNGNLIGGPTHGVIDPKLGPLTNNGGLTQTHGLLVGSPAINAGDPSAIAGVDIVPFYDQRGVPFTRVYGGQIDIGAFEAQAALPGDYNTDGVVDAADYVVWRKAASTANKQGDGNGDSSINSTDYSMWRADFGAGQVSNVAAVGASIVARSVELPASAVIADLAITEVELPTAVSGQSGTVASAAVSSTGRVARVLYRPEARAANSLDALHPELASDRFAPARRSALETDDATKPIDGGAEASNDEAAVLEDAFEALAVLG